MSKIHDNSSESIKPIKIKKFLYDNLPLHNQTKLIKQEYRISDQVADLYIELEDGKRIVKRVTILKKSRYKIFVSLKIFFNNQ